MSGLAKQYNAVNLSQGFPDFECSAELREALTKAMNDGYNQYAPMPGIIQLRETISAKTEALYGKVYNPESEITIVPGATLALFTAITAIVHPGDEVIVIEPAYDCYVPAIELCGGIAIYSSLQYPIFSINWEEIESLVTSKTKVIIINSPQNPGTSVINTNDLERLAKITRNTNIIVISDEVYARMIFDNNYKDILLKHHHLNEWSHPKYNIIYTEGPPHKRKYIVGVEKHISSNINENKYIGYGIGYSHKEGEQNAAKMALIIYGSLKEDQYNQSDIFYPSWEQIESGVNNLLNP